MNIAYNGEQVLAIQELLMPESVVELVDIEKKMNHFSERFAYGFRTNHLAAKVLMNNHPSVFSELLEADLTPNKIHFQNGIAKDHGFLSWGEMNAQEAREVDAHFESTVNLLLFGNCEELENRIKSNPELCNRKSNFGHQAYLINYLGNNGVEMYRQVIPEDFITRLELLIKYGADIHSKMRIYGGEYSTWELFKTSCHPIAAGLDFSKVEKLLT